MFQKYGKYVSNLFFYRYTKNQSIKKEEWGGRISLKRKSFLESLQFQVRGTVSLLQTKQSTTISPTPPLTLQFIMYTQNTKRTMCLLLFRFLHNSSVPVTLPSYYMHCQSINTSQKMPTQFQLLLSSDIGTQSLL